MDPRELKLKRCPSCGGAHVEESYDSSTNEYFIQCVSCGYASERTFVQGEAQILWNAELGDEERSLLEELEWAKEEVASAKRRLEAQEEELEDAKYEALRIEKELRNLREEVSA